MSPIRVTAALSLIEPVIMIIMGIFVAFVLISLYLPIFSLADSVHTLMIPVIKSIPIDP